MSVMTDFAFSRIPRLLAASVLLAAALLGFSSPAAADTAGWRTFRDTFISPEGRVVDSAQGGISHSEGQGYAMLLAVNYDDRSTFDRLWNWTRTTLQVRGDHLLCWRWSPQDGVKDKNNASDGDLLVAWALLRASQHWHNPVYLKASQEIARDIRAKLVHPSAHGLILLPGAEGFHRPEGDSVNLSYWVFPALDEIGQADPSPLWAELAKNGIAILQYAHFGRWALPPDWLTLTKTSIPTDGLSDRFGYNALRIPLYLMWTGRATTPLLKPYRDFWSYFRGAPFLPAWTDLKDDSVDSYDASAGIHRIAQWTLAYPRLPMQPAPAIRAEQGYYSSALLLLTEMAMRESRRPHPSN